MPTHWTVREAVAFNAKLKREPDRSSESTAAWIDVLLETFGLSQVEDTLVGGGERVRGISGGQRRRVSLARGVAARASILFCDEPTSGLSATDAESCITALRDITKKLGVLCVVVIHQPRVEVANMFDRLLLLTANPGRMTYLGPMRDAQQFWEQHGYCVPRTVNAVDYFLDIVTPGTPFDASDALVSIFREVQQPSIDEKVTLAMQSQGLTVREMVSARDPATVKSTPATVKSTRTTRTIGSTWMTGPHSVSWGTQLAVLLARKSRMTFRSPVSVALPLIVPSLQGLVVGYMFQGIAKSEDMLRQIMFIFCLLTMLCVAGTMNLAVLIQDRTVMKYETSEALYTEGAWTVASLLVDVPLALMGATTNVVLMAHLAQMELETFEVVFVWALLLFFVYDSLFACIGAVAVDVRQAQVLACPAVCVFMLCNGMVVTSADAPWILRWIFEISPNAYAMQGIVVHISKDFPLEGPMLLKQFGFTDGEEVGKGFTVLLWMIAILRGIQLLALKFLNQIQR